MGLGGKLIEVKVKEEVAKTLYDWKAILLKKQRELNLVIKEVENYAEEQIYSVYDNRMDNLQSKIKEFDINTEKERVIKLKAEREEAIRVAEANKKSLEEASQKIIANGVNPEAVKEEELKRLKILEEQNQLVLAQLEEANKKLSTTRTLSGALQSRMSYKLDTEKIDKLKVVKFILDNIEHLDLIEVNESYANKVFKPTGSNLNPVIVDGLPFEMNASLITK